MLDDAVLAAFPPHTHPLTLASDPDGVLADDALRAELEARGFHLIVEADPVGLRAQVQRAQPFSAASPIAIITPAPLNTLPYDLWQQGRRVILSLAEVFPGFDPGIVRTLSPSRRRRLRQALDAQESYRSDVDILSRQQSMERVLEGAFDFSGDVVTPARLLSWLARYHAAADPMPSELVAGVVARLARAPLLRGWPLDLLVTNAVAYRRFVQSGWDDYVGALSPSPAAGSRLQEIPISYTTVPTFALPQFGTDEALQDVLPFLVRTGALRPTSLATLAAVPTWALQAVVPEDADHWRDQLASGLDDLDQRLAAVPDRWEDWSVIANDWARLSDLYYDARLAPLPTMLTQRYESAQAALDRAFTPWLAVSYTLLAGQILPKPHHLFHVPQWLAHKRENSSLPRVALIVLDGMSMADWQRIRATWAVRHPMWAIDEQVVLAQAPTITAISRLALIAGRSPNTFSADQLHNRHEPRLWQEFWAQQRLGSDAAVYRHLSDGETSPHEIGSHRTQAICLVITAVDDMVHGATLGEGEVRASLDIWLRARDHAVAQGSPWLEDLIERLLEEDYLVTLTSDHGHVEAIGVGMPREGVVAATRGKRVRLYTSSDLARTAQAHLTDTLFLAPRWLCPAAVFPLVPMKRQAFAPMGERVVTHGGLTIEEMMVPLITLTRK